MAGANRHRYAFDRDSTFMPTKVDPIPIAGLEGIQLLEKTREKRKTKAARSSCDTLLIALRNSWHIVLLLCGLLILIARTLSAYHAALVHANFEISTCNSAIRDWSNHKMHYPKTQDFIDGCVITSQFNPYLYAFDLMSEHVWLLNFLCTRLQNFGISLDGAVAQNFNLMVVFIALCAIIAAMVAYISVEWFRQQGKVKRARNEVGA